MFAGIGAGPLEFTGVDGTSLSARMRTRTVGRSCLRRPGWWKSARAKWRPFEGPVKAATPFKPVGLVKVPPRSGLSNLGPELGMHPHIVALECMMMPVPSRAARVR